MSSTTAMPEIIVFTFPESVFGRRLERYLNLRSLPYTSLRVPPNMPRPVLASLGINHRRIPILSLGRDIYIDTRLILRKLETLFTNTPPLGSSETFDQGIEAMLEEWVISAGPFWRTSGCIPVQAPLAKSEVWMKDRYDGSGGMFTKEVLQSQRAWCLTQLRCYFGVAEAMLQDGRKWLLNTSGPGLAEIHGGWVYDWGIHMGSDMDLGVEEMDAAVGDMRRTLSEKEFPHVHAWIKRFREACEDAKAKNQCQGNKGMLEGEQAEADIVKRILAASVVESEQVSVEEKEVLGLEKGALVTVAPIDFGFTHSDKGRLVGLSRDEAVIEVDVPKESGSGVLRLHYPRVGFKILPADAAEAAKS